jgi:hypothetical protein
MYADQGQLATGHDGGIWEIIPALQVADPRFGFIATPPISG